MLNANIANPSSFQTVFGCGRDSLRIAMAKQRAGLVPATQEQKLKVGMLEQEDLATPAMKRARMPDAHCPPLPVSSRVNPALLKLLDDMAQVPGLASSSSSTPLPMQTQAQT